MLGGVGMAGGVAGAGVVFSSNSSVPSALKVGEERLITDPLSSSSSRSLLLISGEDPIPSPLSPLPTPAPPFSCLNDNLSDPLGEATHTPFPDPSPPWLPLGEASEKEDAKGGEILRDLRVRAGDIFREFRAGESG